MKIIFWGTPEYSIRSLEELIKSKHEIIAVVTQPDKKRSRGGKLNPSPIKALAELNKIPCLSPENIKDDINFVSALKKEECDIFIVIAYGKILTKEILNIPKYGCWNAHASLLPRWRGAAPIQWSIISGDKYTGVGIMKMDVGLDTGNILIEEKIEINENENFSTLTTRLSELSAKLILKSIKVIQNHLPDVDTHTKKQLNLNRELTYARMINKSDYLINLNESALNITRKIKGLYPKAYIEYKKKNLKILSVEIIDKKDLNLKYKINSNLENHKPGNIIGIIKDIGIVVSTITDPIIIKEIKLEGKQVSSKTKLIQQLNPVLGEEF